MRATGARPRKLQRANASLCLAKPRGRRTCQSPRMAAQTSSRTPLVTPGFEAMQRQFEALHNDGEELGSALCIYLGGLKVVDLWGGYARIDRQTMWAGDTRVSTFSACKSMTALCLLHLVDRGLADLDDPVVTHWPNFARGDGTAKAAVTLRHVLSHRAGLPVVKASRPGDVFHWDRMVAALEEAPLLWPAGSRLAYHAVTFGHLVGELVRRISGLLPSAYFDQHIARPLALDYGLRFQSEMAGRTADTEIGLALPRLQAWMMSSVIPRLGGWKAQYFRPCGTQYQPNSAAWRGAEIPAVSGFGTAEGLARFYAMLAGGGGFGNKRVLSAAMVDQMAQDSPEACQEMATGTTARVGLGVFFNHGPLADFGPNPRSFGHCGMGGSVGFVDPDRGIGFGYVCNRDQRRKPKSAPFIGDRGLRLIWALYQSLDRIDRVAVKGL